VSLSDPETLDHDRGRIGEVSILTRRGYQTLMSFPRDSAVQALMRTFVIVEGEVALEPSLQTGHGGVGRCLRT